MHFVCKWTVVWCNKVGKHSTHYTTEYNEYTKKARYVFFYLNHVYIYGLKTTNNAAGNYKKLGQDVINNGRTKSLIKAYI